MNTKNNKRRQATRARIEGIFLKLLQSREIDQITVSDICKEAELNRSTFYANYMDIYDLADAIREKLEEEVNKLYDHDPSNHCGFDYLRLFRHIKEHRIIYETYFKLGYDNKFVVDLSALSHENLRFPTEHMQYHVDFHMAGLNAIIKKWLSSGCKESPETMVQIIQDEYAYRH